VGVQAGCAVPIRSPAAPEYHSSALSVRVRRSRVLIRQVWVRDRSFLVPDGKVVTIGCILTCGRHRARVGEEHAGDPDAYRATASCRCDDAAGENSYHSRPGRSPSHSD
jgi:hypothetical protein